MSLERVGVYSWGEQPVTVIGEPLAVGDNAPDFTLVANDFSTVSMADYAGKVRLISVVPALATGICDAQTHRFNEDAVALNDDVVVLTVSAEHPLNQKSWCGASGIDQVIVLSDHMDMSFGTAYGTYVKERRAERRSVFVVNRSGVITYVEYLPAIGQHPDYEAALEAVELAVKSGE